MTSCLELERLDARILHHLLDKLAVVSFRSLNDPDTGDHRTHFCLPDPPVPQVVQFKKRLKAVQRRILVFAHDLVIAELVYSVDPALKVRKGKQYDQHQSAGDAGELPVTRADAHTEGRGNPDGGGGRDTVYAGFTLKNNSCSHKADAGDDIGRDPVGCARTDHP